METTPVGTDGAKRTWRRKTYVIDPSFQWRCTGLVVLGVFVVSILVSTVLYGLVQQQARARVLAFQPVDGWENTRTLIVMGSVFATIMAGLFGTLAFVLTHRISGPIALIRGYLADLSNGRIPKVRSLRRADEFKAFHDAFRRAVDGLRDQKQADLQTINTMLQLARSGLRGSEDDRGVALTEIISRLEQLETEAVHSLETDAPVLTDPPEVNPAVECQVESTV